MLETRNEWILRILRVGFEFRILRAFHHFSFFSPQMYQCGKT